MALTINPLWLGETLRTVTDTDADNTAENIGATKIYSLDIDNAANAAVEYLKFYNTANPTVGTTVPRMIVHIAASVRRVWTFTDPPDSFNVGMAMAMVTAGGTAGSTSPTSNVIVDIVAE